MAKSEEHINASQSKRFAKLRSEGNEKLDNCIKSQIKDLSTLERIASLSETGRLNAFYGAIGQARTEGHSWRLIAEAATGKSSVKDGQAVSQNYLSFCKNNSIEPIRTQSNS